MNEIEQIASNYSFRIKHIRHPDKGFRKNKILNQAILASSSDYLIFIDSDCVPHSKFVEEHLNEKLNYLVLTGRRVNLSQKLTDLLTEENVNGGFLETNNLRMIEDAIFGESNYIEKDFTLKIIFLENFLTKNHADFSVVTSLFTKRIYLI